VGSAPAATGCCPPGQAGNDIGQGGGFAGSHAGDAGAQWLVQICPVHVPDGSQLQVVSFGGQAHPAAVLPPAVPPTVAPPAVAQPQPTQVASHRSPAGQSASVAHWGCGGWQLPLVGSHGASGSQRNAGQQSSTAVPIQRCVPTGHAGAGVAGQGADALQIGWHVT
jgi:hypothetical protein